MSYGVLMGGWLLYFALHSVLASESVKRASSRVFPKGYRYYRLVYSIVATLGLIALLVVNSNIAAENYFESAGVVRYASLVMTTFGVMIIQVSFRQYRIKGFLGFIQEDTELRKTGILAWIRHPIYAGLILVDLGFFLFIPNQPTLITCLCILTYLPVGIYLEEGKMIGAFGEAYLDYKKEVPALVPRWSKIVSN